MIASYLQKEAIYLNRLSKTNRQLLTIQGRYKSHIVWQH